MEFKQKLFNLKRWNHSKNVLGTLIMKPSELETILTKIIENPSIFMQSVGKVENKKCVPSILYKAGRWLSSQNKETVL